MQSPVCPWVVGAFSLLRQEVLLSQGLFATLFSLLSMYLWETFLYLTLCRGHTQSELFQHIMCFSITFNRHKCLAPSSFQGLCYKKDCSELRSLNMEWEKGLQCHRNANMWPNGQKVNYIMATTENIFSPTVKKIKIKNGKVWNGLTVRI